MKLAKAIANRLSSKEKKSRHVFEEKGEKERQTDRNDYFMIKINDIYIFLPLQYTFTIFIYYSSYYELQFLFIIIFV